MDRRPLATVSRWDVAVSARIGATQAARRPRTRPAAAHPGRRQVQAVDGGLGRAGQPPATPGPAGRRSAAWAPSRWPACSPTRSASARCPGAGRCCATCPPGRIAHHVPTSSSFPSGHSASAAAFAVAVGAEFPELAVPIGALAGAVCFSRIFTGVHFTSDVLAGAALGATVAGIGVAAVPAHHHEPVRLRIGPERPQPSRPDGQGVVAVVSLHSGGGGNDGVAEAFREVLPAAEVVELGPDDDIAEAMKAAAARAEVLGVIGGDGTINAAATAAMDADRAAAGGAGRHLQPLRPGSRARRGHRRGRGPDGRPRGRHRRRRGRRASCSSTPRAWAATPSSSRSGSAGRAGSASRWPPPGRSCRCCGKCPPLAAEVDGVRRRLVMIFIGNGGYSPRGYVPRWRPGWTPASWTCGWSTRPGRARGGGCCSAR